MKCLYEGVSQNTQERLLAAGFWVVNIAMQWDNGGNCFVLVVFHNTGNKHHNSFLSNV
jgi:hypothetical protein